MNRKVIAVVALQAIIIVVLFWVLVFYGRDEYEAATSGQEEAIQSATHIATENGVTVIRLSRASQEQSGILTKPLEAATHQIESTAFGHVLGMDGLTELRTRYLSARTEANVTRAALAGNRQEYERMAKLNRDNRNVSDRAVATALSAWKTDEARLAVSETTAANIRDTMRQQWGETLADWATQPVAPEPFRRLLHSSHVLLQVTLPPEAGMPGPRQTLRIEAIGGNNKVVETTFISASPQADPIVQGKTFYYQAPAETLRAGMRFKASLPAQAKALQGVMVPSSAIVWFADQPWIYLRLGEDRFVRKPVRTDIETASGWFNTGLNAGDETIIRGAQLLLSEEFKYQITNENED